MGQPIQVTSKTGAKRRDAKFERPVLNLLVDRTDTEKMYEEIEPKREKFSLKKAFDKVCPYVLTFLGGFVVASFIYFEWNAYREPGQITGKYNANHADALKIPPICFENSSRLLPFTELDLVNFVEWETENYEDKSCRPDDNNGTLIIGSGGRFLEPKFYYPMQYVFTFEAKIIRFEDPQIPSTAVSNCSCFQVTAYHEFGHTGQLESEEITGCDINGYSWTWTLYPGKHCDRIWLEVKGDCDYYRCFWNYQLNAVEIKSR